MTNPLHELTAVAVAMGKERERLRLVVLLGDVSLTKCECAAWTVDLGFHAPDCKYPVEFDFRERLMAAIYAPNASAESEGPGVSSPVRQIRLR